MRIAIYAAGMPFNGDTISRGESLGGSETAAFYMAKGLAALGHHVICFTTTQDPGARDTVIYQDIGERSPEFPLGYKFHRIMEAPHDVLVLQRNPQGFERFFNTKLNIWWLHDLALKRHEGAVTQSLVSIDKIFTVSEFHRNQVSEVYGVDKEHIIATTNGVDYSMCKSIPMKKRRKNSLIYMARPERGLENLVKPGGIMERLPNCELFVCGYDNTTPEMKGFYDYIGSLCDALPNVTNLGALGKAALYEHMAECMLYVYPTTFEDTSCIAVLEANACGTPVIGSDWSAVPETIGDGGAVLVKLKDGAVNETAFVRAVKASLKPKKWAELNKRALNVRQGWGLAVDQWDKVIKDALAEKSADAGKLAKHLERMSDIAALRHYKLEDGVDRFDEKYGFYVNDTFAEHYTAYYEYEKNRGVEYGPEPMNGNPRFEETCRIIKEANPKTVLDYGCAHGHYTVNLAKRFPGISFVGVDICQTNIDIANKWAKDEGLADRVSFYCATTEGINAHVDRGYFDLILCAEVLEHVPDPQGLVGDLALYLEKDGVFLLSTPYGPWEAQGYKEHDPWRAHIHHFERDDLSDMFGDQDNYKLIALPGAPAFGHFIFTFHPSGKPFGPIDYERKLRSQAPPESLSICMIVKDAAHTLGRCLSKIAHLADEIIIGVDNTTSDATRAIAESFNATIVEIESPLVQGFDAARNITIGLAKSDWILWLDDDEIMENADRLPYYLRQNCYNGYAIAQHHFAAEPAGLFKTDFPCRLFRNRKGIKFFGVVHEHPEQELNKGVGKVCVLPGVAIMHVGYSTEPIRRGRFKRNLPLMARDRKQYPDRILGKMLWVRDLAHMNRYTMERSGGHAGKNEIDNAVHIIETWRDLVKSDHNRYIKESLQYLSEAVNIVTQGNGIEFAVQMCASRLTGGLNWDDTPVKGLFATRDDINLLLGVMQRDALDILDHKYF